MSIISYISEKKAKFRGRIEAQRSQKFEAKKMKIEEIRKANKKLAEEVKIEKEYQATKAQASDLKKEKFRGTIAGRVAENIKKKVAESKKNNAMRNTSQGTIFTEKPTYNNPFSTSGSVGSNPFSKGELGRNIFSGSEAGKARRK